MANLRDLNEYEPHPDHYYRFDIPRRQRPSALKTLITVLVIAIVWAAILAALMAPFMAETVVK